MKYDDLLVTYLGDFGRYQKVQFLLVLLPCIFVSMQALSWTFTGATLDHRCLYAGENKTYQPYDVLSDVFNMSTKMQREIHECNRYSNYTLASEVPLTVTESRDPDEACDAWRYDHSEITNSASSRWNIVCDRKWIKAMVQSMYYIGQAVGSLTFGYVGDRYGRKVAFIIAIIIQAVSGILMSFVPWVEAFAILRMVVGFCHPGVFVISVVIGMELVGPSKRFIGGIATGIFFAFGQVLLAGLAYAIRDYQHLQLTISLPYILFILYWWIVPESARWLISQGRQMDADKVLRKAASWNGRHLPQDWWDQLDSTGGKSASGGGPDRRYTYADIFRYHVIRKRALIQFFCWPTVSMVYYGISMNPSFLGGNRYVTFMLAGLAEIPGVLIAAFTINKLGRKILGVAGFTIAGVMLMLTLAIPASQTGVLTAFVIIAKMTITLTYAVEYTWSPELFPTVVRNQAMGLCSMMARIGGVAASYLIMLVVDYSKVTVVMIFGLFSLAAAVLSMLQPETSGTAMLETIEDAEAFGRNSKILSFKAPNVEKSLSQVEVPLTDFSGRSDDTNNHDANSKNYVDA